MQMNNFSNGEITITFRRQDRVKKNELTHQPEGTNNLISFPASNNILSIQCPLFTLTAKKHQS